jgi:hypothetical protein
MRPLCACTLLLVLAAVSACGGDEDPPSDVNGTVPDGDLDPPDAGADAGPTPDAGPVAQACGALEDHLTDGLDDVGWAFVYETGVLMLENGDTLLDGDVDQTWVYTRDAAGRVLTSVWTRDGAVEYRDIYTWDAEGHMLSYTYDLDGVDPYENATTYTYEGNRRTLAERDRDDDGTIDYVSTYLYTDDDDLWDRVELDHPTPDGVYDSYQEWTYDPGRGLWASIHFFFAGDTVPYDRWERSFDANGYPVEELDYDDAGIIYFRTVYTYDAGGRLLSWGLDSDLTGPELDYLYTYLFTCP